MISHRRAQKREHRAAESDVRVLIWKYYHALRAYRRRPTKRTTAVLKERFDRLFMLETGFVTPDRLLKLLHKNKPLERPEIPFQTMDRKVTFALR